MTVSDGRTLCTCHSHQFSECRGKEGLGSGYVCEEDIQHKSWIIPGRKVTMVPCLTVLNQHGSTTPSTRLPEALIGRWRGGDSVGALAADYGVSAEQIAWGIELAAWRESAVHSPPAKRWDLLRLVSAQLSGFLVFEVRGASGDLVFTTAQKGGDA